MELTRTDTVFSRIAMVLFLCINKSPQNGTKLCEEFLYNKYEFLEPRPTGEGHLGAPPYLVGPLVALRRQLQLHILAFGGVREKKSSRFTIRSRRQALISLGRADLESIRGSEEGDSSTSSSSTILHNQFHDAHRRA